MRWFCPLLLVSLSGFVQPGTAGEPNEPEPAKTAAAPTGEGERAPAEGHPRRADDKATAADDSVAPPQANARGERRDPFAPAEAPERPAAASDGMVAARDSDIPTGIRVRGIVRVKEREPVAIITVPGNPDPYFVREEEVIRIETGARGRRTRASAAHRSKETARSHHAPPLPPRARPGDMESRHETPEATRQHHAQAQGPDRQATGVFYLYVSKIGDRYVEAYPRARPDDKQIFR